MNIENMPYVDCPDCNKNMNPENNLTEGCTMPFIIIGTKTMKRIPYKNKYRKEVHFCHDCSVQLGQIHHYGCDMEVCPNCKGQLFICNCSVMGVIPDKFTPPKEYKDRKIQLMKDLGLS